MVMPRFKLPPNSHCCRLLRFRLSRSNRLVVLAGAELQQQYPAGGPDAAEQDERERPGPAGGCEGEGYLADVVGQAEAY